MHVWNMPLFKKSELGFADPILWGLSFIVAPLTLLSHFDNIPLSTENLHVDSVSLFGMGGNYLCGRS